MNHKQYQQLLFCEYHQLNSAGAEMRWNHKRGVMLSTGICAKCGAAIVALKDWERE